jgi:hypothetical protein
MLTFRGALRAEESLFLGFQSKEIPRFARNEKINYFFRSLFSLSGLRRRCWQLDIEQASG